ncbi:gamma-glutamylcyclotransferase family protein [Breoghania sp.]|uniref:gamma-glutamylcyclotransferase family protein n=1 Tax=Breoghania sp. TaxID=2065378 RepID=UPI002AA66507|nr:gamma-glutamylcyclotransferase family protein [Breoghania sp.]
MTDTISYFGYGSLVNDSTRPANGVAVPGRLSGWRREWRIAGRMGNFGVCSLTVRPDASREVAGLMVREDASGLPDLDEREWRYERCELAAGAFRPDNPSLPPMAGFVYTARAEHYRWGDADHPILQSYVDCVLAGFLKYWGEAGVREFVQTTCGWHVPILPDRDEPFYPRAVKIDTQTQALFDDVLRKGGACWL